MTPPSTGIAQQPTTETAVNRSANIPWWIIALVIAGALLTAMGAVIALVRPAMLASPQDQINGAVKVFAGYLFARNLALSLAMLGLLALRAKRALGNLMVLVALVQMLDVCMDCAEGRWAIVPGIFAFGVLYLVGAARLSGSPFWRRAAWT